MLKDYDGKTPLHKCAQNIANKPNDEKLKTCAKILIEFDSNLVSELDNKMKSPSDYCTELLSIID